MVQGEKHNQRRTYFIQKGFQAGMILKFVSLLVIMAAISSTILYFVAGSKLETSYFEAHSSIKSMWDILGPTVLITNFVSLAVISVATVYVILFISHKIAGPLHKVEKNMNEIADGNLAVQMHLRKGDQIQSLGDALDNMIVKLSERMNVIKDATLEISDLEKTLESFAENEFVSKSEADQIRSQLSASVSKLNNELAKFQLK